MADQLLIDTDVLIDYLRGTTQAVSYLEGTEDRLAISVISVAELFSGVRKGPERQQLENFLTAFDIVPLDPRIAVKAGLFRRDFGKSHGVGLADAMIAATAMTLGASLVTLNVKHFPMLKEVVVPYQKP